MMKHDNTVYYLVLGASEINDMMMQLMPPAAATTSLIRTRFVAIVLSRSVTINVHYFMDRVS